jgi:hypothetical protein
MRRFEIETSGLERREESLDAPATGIVPQRGLGSRVGDEDEQLTIGQTGGEDLQLAP